jgi:hypothetical protein
MLLDIMMSELKFSRSHIRPSCALRYDGSPTTSETA